MLKNLKLENFACFDLLELTDFKRINLFAGKNNTGKTSLLEAIAIAAAPFDENLANKLNNLKYFSSNNEREKQNNRIIATHYGSELLLDALETGFEVR